MAPATSHHLYPPFAEGVTAAPLVSISLARLEADDDAESEAFFKACKELGFFYLNMEGSALGEKMVSEAEKIFAVQQQFTRLPDKDKDQFEREKLDPAYPFFGYRLIHGVKKENGVIERDEIYNVSSSSFLVLCQGSS